MSRAICLVLAIAMLLGSPWANSTTVNPASGAAYLVDDQTMALTGRRYLSGYSSTEAQFAGLMDAGVAYAQAYQLTPGVTLSAEQMALLTTDIVWMEMQTITLADGSTTQALAPRVYLRRPVNGDLAVTGALISGSQVNITSTAGNIQNTGTVLAYGGTTTPGTVNLTATTGSVSNGGTLTVLRSDHQTFRHL